MTSRSFAAVVTRTAAPTSPSETMAGAASAATATSPVQAGWAAPGAR